MAMNHTNVQRYLDRIKEDRAALLLVVPSVPYSRPLKYHAEHSIQLRYAKYPQQ